MMNYAFLFVLSAFNVIKKNGVYILCTTLVVFILLEMFVEKKKENNLIDYLKSLFFALTLSVILGTTILGREWFAVQDSFQFQIFYSYKRYIQSHNRDDLYEIIQNIVLYIPFSVALMFKSKKNKRIWWNLLICFCLSAFTEIAQGITGMGLFQIDDVINNLMGALCGCVIGKQVRKRIWKNSSTRNKQK